jgi:hypothetical protein
MTQKRSRQDFELMINERANNDPAFRKELIENPKGVLERELGRKLLPAAKVQVVEESDANLVLVLRPKPQRPAGELDEKQLDAVAAGAAAVASSYGSYGGYGGYGGY